MINLPFYLKNLLKSVSFGLSSLSLILLLVSVPANAQPVDFAFTDFEGQERKLSHYKGQWVLVNFWATWCPPCRKEIPELSDFHLENEDAVVIGVNYEPGIKDERLKSFIASYLITYPVTRINDDIIDALGEPRGLPTSVLINPQGEVVKTIAGIVTDKTLNQLIAQYAKSK